MPWWRRPSASPPCYGCSRRVFNSSGFVDLDAPTQWVGGGRLALGARPDRPGRRGPKTPSSAGSWRICVPRSTLVRLCASRWPVRPADSTRCTAVWWLRESRAASWGVLDKLATDLEEQQALKSKLIGATLYPAIVSVFAVLIVVALLVFVVPQVAQVFTSSKRALCLCSRRSCWRSAPSCVTGAGCWPWCWLAALAA